MKRIILLFTIIAVISGCSINSQINKKVEEVVHEVKEVNILHGDQMSDTLKEELTREGDKIQRDLFKTLEIDDNVTEYDEYDTLKENMKSLQSNLEYEIESIKLNDNKTTATLVLNIDYISMGDLFTDTMEENLGRSILKMSSGEPADTFVKDVLTSLNEGIEKIDVEDSMETKKVEVVFKEMQDDWKMTDLNDNAVEVFTLGMSKYARNDLTEKLDNVKANRAFLEVESNFNNIAKEIEKSFSSKKTTFDNFTKKGKSKLSKHLEDEVGVKVSIVKSAGKKNDVYYIMKGDKSGEIKISVKFNNEEYTVVKEIKLPKKNK